MRGGRVKTSRDAAAAREKLHRRLEKFPRLPLTTLPTPLHRLENLSSRLGGPDIWMKRDDLTGLAFGGNKSRKLEFILPDAKAQGADTLVTWGGLQSNWCLQTAAAARKSGLNAALILFAADAQAPEADGNLFLDRLAGAEVRFVGTEGGRIITFEAAEPHIAAMAEAIRSRGGTPYVIPIGGSMPGGSMTRPLGAVAYVRTLVETVEQALELGLDVGAIVHASGSGSTQAGLVVAARALGLDLKVIGVSVSEKKETFGRLILELCRRTEETLGIEARVGPDDVVVMDDHIGPGYGFVDSSVARTLARIFREEAVTLDPVYTAKAMAGLEDLARRGFLPRDRAAVFVHTGGTPALFPYRREILSLIP